MAKVNDFEPCCPHCYSEDFQPVEYVKELYGVNGWRFKPSGPHPCGICGLVGVGYAFVLEGIEDRPAEYRHGTCHVLRGTYQYCNQCGKVFEREAAIELKLLEPVMV